MDIISGLAHGFAVALQPTNLFWCFVGCFMGTIVGIMPGLGPAATIALLLPLTLNMDPAGGIIMLAGIYYGAKYGGSTTSILLNVPGEASSVVTCIDGYQMARRGRAGAALGIAAIASFVAGTFGVILLTLAAPPIAAFALSFSSPEYFALMALGLALAVLLSGASLIKGLLALLVGLWLTSIGTDLFTAQSRFTFGQAQLLGGIDFMVVAIGVFAIAEVLASIEAGVEAKPLPVPRGLAQLVAELGGVESLPLCLSQRLAHRLYRRGVAGRRIVDRVFSVLRHREGGLEASGKVRHRRAGRRGGAGGRQQRRFRRRARSAC